MHDIDDSWVWKRWHTYGFALGQKIRQARDMRGLSQTDLAELACMSRNQISNLERNITTRNQAVDPKLSTVYRLAAALDVPPVVLLPGAGERIGYEFTGAMTLEAVSMTWPENDTDVARFSGSLLELGGVRAFAL